MAPLADGINAAAANTKLDRRNDGIALTDVQVIRNHPTYIKYKWSSHRRSPNKFTVWLRNVQTQDYYKADPNVATSAGSGQVGLGSLNHKTGTYQLVLTEYNNYNKVFARSYTFNIDNNDF